jgi:hypothetical protein
MLAASIQEHQPMDSQFDKAVEAFRTAAEVVDAPKP